MGRLGIAVLGLAAGCSFAPGQGTNGDDVQPTGDGGSTDSGSVDAAVTTADAMTDAAKMWMLIDTLKIETYAPNLTPQPTLSTVTLTLGTMYRLRATGTFTCTSTNVPADAEYWDFQTPQDFASGIDFGLSIDNSSVDGQKTPQQWGAFTASHTYEVMFTGKGAKISAVLYDSQYNNNNGQLTLEVFELK